MTQVPLEDLVFHNISQGCAMAFRKEIRDLYLQYFVEELPHDWILNVVASKQKKCYFINRPLFCYRIHHNNAIGVNDHMALQKKRIFETRIFDAQNAITVLNLIQNQDEAFYHANPQFSEMKLFAEKHVEYLKERNLIGILLQNFNSCYKKLKTIRGRLLDIYFVLNK